MKRSLLLIGSAAAYIQHPDVSRPTRFGVKVDNRPKKAVYDLGLGQNPPVGRRVSSSAPTSVHEAVAFLHEHQGVNDLPRPVVVPDKPAPPKKFQPIIPERIAVEYLTIVETQQRPTMTTRTPTQFFDMNTPWVELLIHEQQQKLAFQH